MYIWIVKDGFGENLDYFATAEGAYSFMESEIDRWNDEYPLDIPDSLAFVFKKRLYNDFKENNSCFKAGDCFKVGEYGADMDWCLKAIRVEVKE